MQALILSAGYGTRLKPITDEIPKPLMPVLNAPVVEYNIRLLAYYGVTEVFINLHHHAAQIEDRLGSGSAYGVKITYLYEKEILGTGGSIASMKEYVKKPFYVINGDIICDFNLEKLADAHASTGAIVTLGLLPAPETDTRAVVTLDSEGRIIRMLNKTASGRQETGNAIFSGLHLIDPRLFEYLPQDIFYSITGEVYAQLVEQGTPIRGLFMEGPWWDIGSPSAYLQCSFDLLRKLPLTYFNPFERYTNPPRSFETSTLVAIGKVHDLPAVPIRPPVILGNNVKVEGNSELGPWLIAGDGAQLSGRRDKAVYLPGADNTREINCGAAGTIYY